MFFFKLLFAHRKTSWILFLATFALLVYGIFTPQVSTSVQVPNLDKIVHFGGFLIVFLLGRFATNKLLNWGYWLLPAIAAVLFEYLQGQWVATRDFSYMDMLANILGVITALVIWVGLVQVVQPERNHQST